MGWKNVRDHYKIDHIVQVRDGRISIGSSFINDLILISLEGKLIHKEKGLHKSLQPLVDEMEASPETLEKLVKSPDHFSASIPVYTYKGAEIIEKLCEEPGWPNVTHDGCLMYENTFSTDKQEVIEWAKNNARSGISGYTDFIARQEEDLQKSRDMLSKCQEELASLESNYPQSTE